MERRGANAPGVAGPVPGVAGRVAGIPRRVRDRGVARAGLATWTCRNWRLSSCPGASGVTARPPATASGWPRSRAGRWAPGIRRPFALPASTTALSGGRGRVAAGRAACQRAAHVLRSATALRVTRRPPRGSDGNCGPCGPAWTGASRPTTTLTGTRRTAGFGATMGLCCSRQTTATPTFGAGSTPRAAACSGPG